MNNKRSGVVWCISNSVWYIMQRLLPAKAYLSLRYRLIFGRWIDWANPKTFTEKLQWLKINYYGEDESHLVDKLLVKSYVAENVGEEYVLPTLGVWESATDIDYTILPNEFVLKCNHDSGSIIFVRNAHTIDKTIVTFELNRQLNVNYYWTGCETPYKYIEPKIFAEPLINCPTNGELRDYKFFCFNGEPKIFKIDFDRFIDHHANYYDVNGTILPFGEVAPSPVYERQLEIPNNLSEMLAIARNLAQGLPFARVDLYNLQGKIKFGEITLFPTSGFGKFTDPEWDLRLGSWLELPNK